jgi:hypothetical protein
MSTFANSRRLPEGRIVLLDPESGARSAGTPLVGPPVEAIKIEAKVDAMKGGNP